MTVSTATITISTTPMIASNTSLARRGHRRPSHVGVLARVVAGVAGALLGIAIGLVSAGIVTTQLLLVVGAAVLALGWFFAVISERVDATSDHR